MQSEILIRPIRDGEKAAAQQVMRRAFSLTARPFFTWSDDVLVAVHADRIVGGVVLEHFKVAKDLKIGFVSWIFTDPDVRGLGAGQGLIEAALAFFEVEGCDEVSACVEGYNTSSAKLFATRGFSILSPGAQLRRYGLGIIPHWWHAFHFMDVGHFLWVKPGAARPDSPALQWLGTWVANTLLLWLAVGRQRAWDAVDLWTIPAALLLLLGLRTLVMWAAARAQGLAVRFRAWESSVPLVAAIALAFGGFFPFPGSLYPVAARYRYRELLNRLGPMALAGSLAVLALAVISGAALRWGWASGLISLWQPLFQIGRILALLDTVVAFFPLASYNGRRLWDWNRGVWAALSLIALALLFM
jgi:GNAT superfamily N-acetyltransferase